MTDVSNCPRCGGPFTYDDSGNGCEYCNSTRGQMFSEDEMKIMEQRIALHDSIGGSGSDKNSIKRTTIGKAEPKSYPVKELSTRKVGDKKRASVDDSPADKTDTVYTGVSFLKLCDFESAIDYFKDKKASSNAKVEWYKYFAENDIPADPDDPSDKIFIKRMSEDRLSEKGVEFFHSIMSIVSEAEAPEYLGKLE